MPQAQSTASNRQRMNDISQPFEAWSEAPSVADEADDRATGSRATILVVEDDPSARAGGADRQGARRLTR
jgi:hypothetical protein